jgi:hypothetical protein
MSAVYIGVFSLTCSQIWLSPLVDDCHSPHKIERKNPAPHTVENFSEYWMLRLKIKVEIMQNKSRKLCSSFDDSAKLC